MGWWPKFQIVSSESVQRALLSHFGYRGECHTDQRPLVVLRCSCRRQMTRPLPPPRRTEWWVLGGLWMHHKDIQKHRHTVRWILRTSDMLLWLQEHGLIGIDVNVTECKKNKHSVSSRTRRPVSRLVLWKMKPIASWIKICWYLSSLFHQFLHYWMKSSTKTWQSLHLL